MRKEKIKSKKLNLALLSESKAREKMRKNALRDIISRLYKETLKAERERIREERAMLGSLVDPEENRKREAARTEAIENYFNERIKMVNEVRDREAEERRTISHAQSVEAKRMFRDEIQNHDMRLTKAANKVRNESDQWLTTVKELDTAAILHNNVLSSHGLKDKQRKAKRQAIIRNVALAYLPEYAKRF